jgi:uncharacterized protein YcbK (DUF882 family)
MIKSYLKDSKEMISEHFSVAEFRCPCSQCVSILLDTDLITKLEAVRAEIGKPLRINSGYRCSNYQSELRLRGYETSTGRSTHEDGGAADCMAEPLTGLELETAARKAGFTSIGIGGTWIHCDIRPGNRRWVYSQR